jgi:hypothetical protein
LAACVSVTLAGTLPAEATACYTAWDGVAPCTNYAAGAQVSHDGINYHAQMAHCNETWIPFYSATVWASEGVCGGGPTPTSGPTATATSNPSATATNTATATSSGCSGIECIVSTAMFQTLTAGGVDYYTQSFNDFKNAANTYPTFGGSDGAAGYSSRNNSDGYRYEVAAAFGHWQHESDLFRATDEYFPPANHYCINDGDCGSAGCCPGGTPNGQYWGKGPEQLSHCYNYKAAATALSINIWNQPTLISSTPNYGWRTAMWYRMTQGGPLVTNWPVETSHKALRNNEARSPVANRYGFAGSTRAINGSLECINGDARQTSRITKFAGSDMVANSSGGNLQTLGYQGGSFGFDSTSLYCYP